MKNVVFGVYRFLGFHLCNYLLESGQEVAGYDWKVEEDEAEEKRKMFERNANYSYDDEKWKTTEGIQLYICLYDYLENPSYSVEQFRQLMAYIDYLMEKVQKNKVEIVILLPVEDQDHLHCIMNEWKLKIEQKYVVRYLYISELYGPWSPPYKPIMNILKKKDPVLKANMSKYIYIDDFFQSWKDIMVIQKKEIFVEGIQAESVSSASKQVDVLIEAKISLREGMELIKEHHEKVEILRKWNS